MISSDALEIYKKAINELLEDYKTLSGKAIQIAEEKNKLQEEKTNTEIQLLTVTILLRNVQSHYIKTGKYPSHLLEKVDSTIESVRATRN